jgi:hypothetical protein
VEVSVVQYEGLCHDVIAEVELRALHDPFAVETRTGTHQGVPIVGFGLEGIDVLNEFPCTGFRFQSFDPRPQFVSRCASAESFSFQPS